MARTLEDRIDWLVAQIRRLNKRGAVVQLSGGVDSSTVLHLCAKALGPERVVGLYLPDDATSPDTYDFVAAAATNAGVLLVVESIGAAIEAQQPADFITHLIRRYAPEFDPLVHGYSINASPEIARRLGALVYQLWIGPRHGAAERVLPVSVSELRSVIAYQNRKQRTRMLSAYAEAERRNYAVVGASNGDELATGFVVKYGDDAADLCAIGDLDKPGVYALAEELGVPPQIIGRPPTTDTYGLRQTQDEYYYALPARVLREIMNLTPAQLADDTTLAALMAQTQAPHWTAAALRQAATGLRASLLYQQTRSATIDHGYRSR